MDMVEQGAASSLLKIGLRLEYVTLGWNVVGVFVVLFAAVRSGSVALAGFGLDSLSTAPSSSWPSTFWRKPPTSSPSALTPTVLPSASSGC